MIRSLPEPGMTELALDAEPALQWISGEQSNSSVVIGGKAILKLLRNAPPGLSAEVEMSRHLTRAGYANIPALLGEIQRVDGDGVPCTLAVLYAYIANEGDAWNWTLDYLKRTLATALLGGDSPEEFEASLEGYATQAATIGRRLAQLHQCWRGPATIRRSPRPSRRKKRPMPSPRASWASSIRPPRRCAPVSTAWRNLRGPAPNGCSTTTAAWWRGSSAWRKPSPAAR